MVPVAVLGFSLLGGVCLGVLVLALSGALEDAAKGGFKMAAPVVLVVGLVPVSYTHLDVYKRQVHHAGAYRRWRVHRAGCGFLHHEVLR